MQGARQRMADYRIVANRPSTPAADGGRATSETQVTAYAKISSDMGYISRLNPHH